VFHLSITADSALGTARHGASKIARNIEVRLFCDIEDDELPGGPGQMAVSEELNPNSHE
jgi:hypothetical protein